MINVITLQWINMIDWLIDWLILQYFNFITNGIMYVNPLIGIPKTKNVLGSWVDVMRKVEIGHCQKCLPCIWPSHVIIKESGFFPWKVSGTLSTRKSHMLIRNDMGVNKQKTLYNCVWPAMPSRHEDAMC